MNLNFRNSPLEPYTSLAFLCSPTSLSPTPPLKYHLTLVSLCLQDDDSDFLCSYASVFYFYGSIPKGKCGGAFYFVVFVKKKSKTKRRNKFLKKKIERKKNAKKRVIFLFYFQ